MVTEVWKGFYQNALMYNSPGEDSVPCKGDQVILVKTDGSGKYIACGVLSVSRGAKPGEKIIYGRDAEGNVVSKISMLNDGSIIIYANNIYTIDGETDIAANAKENIDIIAGKKALIQGADVEISGAVKTSGGSFECGGSVSPTGTGCLCALPFCAWNGAPQTGNKAEGT